MKKQMAIFGFMFIAAVLLCGCNREEALTVYVVQTEALYMDGVEAFSKEHPEVRLNIVFLESYEEAKDRLDVELMSGAGPDVLLFNSLYSGTDSYKLAMGGAILSLDEEVEALPEGEYFDDILNAGKIDGHQYFVPLSWNLLQIYSSQEKITEKGYTDDLYTALSSEMQALKGDGDYCASSFQLGRQDVLQLFLETAGFSLIDLENGRVLGDKEEFGRIAEYVKLFYDNMEKMRTVTRRYANDFAGAVSHVTYLLENFSFMNNLRYYQSIYPNLVDEEMYFAPFKQMEGQGLTAQVIQYGAVNTNTQNAESAWELLKYLMDAPINIDFPKYETESIYYAPVNALVYEEGANRLSSEHGFGPGMRVEPLSEANSRMLLEMPSRIEGSVIPNLALGDLIQECMEPYFLGEDSFDSCYDRMMQRVELYLNE